MNAGGVRKRRGRIALAVAAIGVTAAGLALSTACTPTPKAGWHVAWRGDTAFFSSTSKAQTCRFAARLSGRGSSVQVEFTSPWTPGKGYTITAAGIAAATGPATLAPVAGTGRTLYFAGRKTAAVAAGGTVRSDPVQWTVSPGTNVLVTVTVGPGDATLKAFQTEKGACATGVLANATGAPSSSFPLGNYQRWLRSILVNGPALRSVVGFGDSITEGPMDQGYHRWTDTLATSGVFVANAAASGGEVTGWGAFGSMPGPVRAKAVLAEPNVTDFVMLMGTNDLWVGKTPAAVLDAMSTIITQVNAIRAQAWVATILPRTGSGWTAQMERNRQQVNAAIRGSWLTSRFAKLIDTDAVVRDPAHPASLQARYDSGDHTHPNAAGSRAIGLAVGKALGLPVH